MKRVMLFFVMSVVSSTTLFCMDKAEDLEKSAAQESARIFLNGIFSELSAQN